MSQAIAWALALLLPGLVIVQPQPPLELRPKRSASETEDAIYDALAKQLPIKWHLDRGTVRFYKNNCHLGATKCLQRLRTFARHFVAAGLEHGVDPWVLAGMAYSESRCNPMAEGAGGERTIMQFTRNTARKRGGELRKWWHDQKFMVRCLSSIEACQKTPVDQAARIISERTRDCGSLDGALGFYNSGRCRTGTRYGRRVMAAAAKLMASGGEA